MKSVPWRAIAVIIIQVIATNNPAWSQPIHPSMETEPIKMGLFIGYGAPNLAFLNLNIEYDYHVLLIQGQMERSLSSKKIVAVDLVIQPQINTASFAEQSNSHSRRHNWEVGVGLGLLVRSNMKKRNWSPYLLASIGPHFISSSLARQSKGFIFSDNVWIGFKWNVNYSLCMDVRLGFRHLSNAGIKQPNGGINSLQSGIGILWGM